MFLQPVKLRFLSIFDPEVIKASAPSSEKSKLYDKSIEANLRYLFTHAASCCMQKSSRPLVCRNTIDLNALHDVPMIANALSSTLLPLKALPISSIPTNPLALAGVQQCEISAATPGVLTTSNNDKSDTFGSNFNNNANGCPIPPDAPKTATYYIIIVGCFY
jgi:hypothetical protein